MLAERIGSAQLLELSAAGAGLTEDVRGSDLPRVAALLAAHTGGQLEVALRFRNGPEDFPVVEVIVTGLLPLVCQRCLAAVDWPVDLQVALTVVPDEATAGELADPFDSVLLDRDGALPLRSMVEDEILAMMPLAPLHDAGKGCNAAAGDAVAQIVEPVPEARVNRPFAGLGVLIRDDGRDRK
ncbi:MAG: hypothetical protein AMXMBFR45_23010 [Gammaproteobacteria bacterium]|nr:MAG: hypothetical protein EDM71_02435 [Pseudomonadota bacterium]MBC6944102.1 hypothetical protein [Gammaproteobacteria bacterium]MCE7896447.1 hypothetical protein [Gammaproteobacteria bacterium PRO8]MDL1880420.1 hypothetical protein [Gammaproteobacteria bacterium PRO2]MCQ3933462.1 hypothetical protein [Gammaproteobacteria bacterium]